MKKTEETPAQEFERLCAIPLSQTTPKIQRRIRALSNHPDNCGPRSTGDKA